MIGACLGAQVILDKGDKLVLLDDDLSVRIALTKLLNVLPKNERVLKGVHQGWYI